MNLFKIQKLLKYRQTSGDIIIRGPEGFCVGLDGELYFGTEFRVRNIKHAILQAILILSITILIDCNGVGPRGIESKTFCKVIGR